MTDDQIQSGVDRCCPVSVRTCCEAKLRADQPIACAAGQVRGTPASQQDLQMAVCLERLLHNTTTVRDRGE